LGNGRNTGLKNFTRMDNTTEQKQGTKINWVMLALLGTAGAIAIWYFFFRQSEDIDEKMKKVREAKELKRQLNLVDNVSEN